MYYGLREIKNSNRLKLYVVAHIDNHGNSTNPLFNELAICSSTNVTAMGLADKSAEPKMVDTDADRYH